MHEPLVGAGTGCLAVSLLLYGNANATAGDTTAQPEKLPPVHRLYAAVPVALKAQKVPDGHGIALATVEFGAGQYVPAGQPTQAAMLALL